MQRPEPSQVERAGAGLIDAADAPLAAEDAVIKHVLVDAMAKAGRAHREGHCGAYDGYVRFPTKERISVECISRALKHSSGLRGARSAPIKPLYRGGRYRDGRQDANQTIS
jgi:hypothetical protein